MEKFEVIDILLVDDRKENLMALEALLANPGYNLVSVLSGEEALRYLLDHEPALILMDVQMPSMNGFEAASIIKMNSRTRDIPIVFVTAVNTDERFVQEGYRGGAVDYLYKPLDPDILRAKVATFAELHRKTERALRAERALRESEARSRELKMRELEFRSLRREQAIQRRYRDLIRGITHGIVWSADPKTFALTFVSASAAKISSLSEESWLRDPEFLRRHIHLEDAEKFFTAAKSVAASEGEASVEHRFLAGDGRILWFQTGVRLEPKADGSGDELGGVSVDITRLKETEDLLTRSKANAEFMAEASYLLSTDLDLDTLVVSLGDLAVPRLASWYSLFLLDERDRLKMLSHKGPVDDPVAEKKITGFLLNEQGEPKLVSQALEEMRTGSSPEGVIKSLELKTVLAGGGPEFVSAMFLPLLRQGKIFGTMTLAKVAQRQFDSSELVIAIDLARRVAVTMDNATLYRTTKEAVQMRDEFLSIASHELKTPLTPLLLQAQMMSRILRDKTKDRAGDEKIVRMIDSSSYQISRLNRLIDELMDISRISAKKLVLRPTDFDFREVLTDLIERYNAQIQESGSSVTLYAPDSIPVFWDRSRMEQVAVNLLTNAIKYGMGKPIELYATMTNGDVSFVVRDHGIGIEEQDRQRIFKRFERAASSTRISGLGLGLYIVSELLKAHQGAINVESVKGDGSTFKVKVPAKIQWDEGQRAAFDGKSHA